MKTLIAMALASCLGVLVMAAQCEHFDNNGDGILTGADMLPVLAAFGTEESMPDANGDGVVDAEDVLLAFRHLGANCPATPHAEVSGLVTGLVLQEVHVFSEALSDGIGTIPAGSVQYRLYAQTSVPSSEAAIQAVFGRENAPLTLSSDAGWFVHPVNTGLAADAVSPLFYEAMPTLAHSTWWTTGPTPEDFASAVSNVGSLTSLEPLDLAGAAEVVWDTPAGGAWWLAWSQPPTANGSTNPTLHLLGQFTTLGGPAFSGTLNLIAQTAVDGSTSYNAYERLIGLTFNHETSVETFGCTNPEALNFNPEAIFEDGSCQIAGDLNGDGAFTIEDLLAFIAAFGCIDCPDVDFNGDGTVSVQDLMLLLGWWG